MGQAVNVVLALVMSTSLAGWKPDLIFAAENRIQVTGPATEKRFPPLRVPLLTTVTPRFASAAQLIYLRDLLGRRLIGASRYILRAVPLSVAQTSKRRRSPVNNLWLIIYQILKH